MSTRYPDSICEAHLSVRTSEPVCIVCMGNQIADLQSQLAAAERSRDRHRADAERYRWLRTHVAWSELYEEVFDGPDSEGRMELLVADELDAAIDASLSPTVSEGAIDSSGNRSGEGGK